MKITVDNKLILKNVPHEIDQEVLTRLTFPNPAYVEAKKMGRWLGNLEQFLSCYECTRNGLILPRGFARQLIGLCRHHGMKYQIGDQRRTLPEVDFQFQGQLRPFQEKAVDDIQKREFGTASAPTGSGKTVMALYVIAERKQPALVVVHTKELLNQWVDRIETFLGIPKEDVGIIGDGKKRIGEKITVGMVQTVYKCADKIREYIGHLIVDECHRAPSRTFTEAVTAFDSKYMLGLSATPYRRDRLSRLIFWHLGDLVHQVEKEALLETGDIVPADVVIRETNFTTSLDPSGQYSKMLSELTEDRERNSLIASDIAREANNGGGVCLALSDRKAHCKAIQGLLRREGIPSEILTGDLTNGNRKTVLDRLNQGAVKVLVATGQLIGEGFDCPAFSTLFLTTPIKFNGRVIQYLGRILRPAPGKEKAKVFDYADVNVGVLVTSAKSRQKIYDSLNSRNTNNNL